MKDGGMTPAVGVPIGRRLLDVDGLARYLSMPKGTIYTYVSLGRIPKDCIRHIGRSLRFDVAAVDRWVDAQQAPPGQVASR